MSPSTPLPDPWACWPHGNPYDQFGPEVHENSTIEEVHAAYMALLEDDLLDDAARSARAILERPTRRLQFDLLLYDEETVRLLQEASLPAEPRPGVEQRWHERLPLTWDS